MTTGQFGPKYNVDSAVLGKFRQRAKSGLCELSYDDRRAYGAAVEAAVLASQRSFLKSHGESMPSPHCASGSWATTADGIEKAVRARIKAEFNAACKYDRERTPKQWQSLYDDAMRAKCNSV